MRPLTDSGERLAAPFHHSLGRPNECRQLRCLQAHRPGRYPSLDLDLDLASLDLSRRGKSRNPKFHQSVLPVRSNTVTV